MFFVRRVLENRVFTQESDRGCPYDSAPSSAGALAFGKFMVEIETKLALIRQEYVGVSSTERRYRLIIA